MFLLLEDGGVILMDDIVALTRRGGRTVITLGSGAAGESAFTPATLIRRSRRFISQNKGHTAARLARRTRTTETEDY